MASASVVPASSRSANALPGAIAPLTSREPMQATPKRAPSSSVKFANAIGRGGRQPDACNSATAASADATPSGPSSGPPW